MKIFLINLKERTDRLARTSVQLNDLRLPFQKVIATNGKSVNVNDFTFFNKYRFILENKRETTSGEIGCSISHRSVWKKIVSNCIPYSLILEDDISISPELSDFINSISNYQYFDFINISSTTPYRLDPTTLSNFISSTITVRPPIWKKNKRKLWKNLEWRSRWRIFKLHNIDSKFTICECDPAPALGSGYILSLHGAKSLLKTTEHMFYPVDLSWRYCGGSMREGFLATPLIKQDMPGDTNIEGRTTGYTLNAIQKFLRFFLKSRRLKRRWDVLRMYGIFRR